MTDEIWDGVKPIDLAMNVSPGVITEIFFPTDKISRKSRQITIAAQEICCGIFVISRATHEITCAQTEIRDAIH